MPAGLRSSSTAPFAAPYPTTDLGGGTEIGIWIPLKKMSSFIYGLAFECPAAIHANPVAPFPPFPPAWHSAGVYPFSCVATAKLVRERRQS